MATLKPQAINPCKCPLCGEPNQCAMANATQGIGGASTAAPPPCWCASASFSADLLNAVPDVAKNKACICSACAAQT